MGVVPPQDEAGSSQAARRERGEDDAADHGYGEEDDGEVDEAEAPSDFAKLRACIPCKLVKTHNQVCVCVCVFSLFFGLA